MRAARPHLQFLMKTSLPSLFGKPLWGSRRFGGGRLHPSCCVPLADGELWSFYKTDVWHNFHMGVAKYWVSGSLVAFLENLLQWDDLSMEDRLSPQRRLSELLLEEASY